MPASTGVARWPLSRARACAHSDCHTAVSMGAGIQPTSAAMNSTVERSKPAGQSVNGRDQSTVAAASAVAATVPTANTTTSSLMARSSQW